MSQCLLVAATALEIAPFLEHYRNQPDFPAGDLHPDVLISGVGLAATTYSLTRYISVRRPDFIIQAGIGGSFDPAFPPGTVVAISRDTIADQGVVEKGELKTIFDLQLAPSNQAPYSRGWLVNKNEILKKIRLKKVIGISVNAVSTTSKTLSMYGNKFKPVIESMEGAALHYVGIMENIPFLQLRSISNLAGERDKSKWHLKQSIINLNNELINLFETKEIFTPY
jgi:futalosine hydrolase